MKIGHIAGGAVVALGLSLAQTQAQAQTKMVYEAGDAGLLTIELQPDNVVTGTYTKYDGHIKGTLKGTDRIDGTWWQGKGAKDDVKCPKPMNGTVFWGKFTLIEDADQKGFHGMWGSCDEEPNETWNGKLKQ